MLLRIFGLKASFHDLCKAGFLLSKASCLHRPRSRMLTSIFKGMSGYLIDWLQNTTPRGALLHELKKSLTFQDCFTLVTQDSIGHLQTLCLSVLLLSDSIEMAAIPAAQCPGVQNSALDLTKFFQRDIDFTWKCTLVWYTPLCNIGDPVSPVCPHGENWF